MQAMQNNTLKLCAALTIANLISSATATELTLYPSFAEVRENVQLTGGRFDWTPPADLGDYLVPGSLELEYKDVLSMQLLPPTDSLLAMFEGKTVKVYFDEEWIEAKVIKADIGLFEIDGEFIRLEGAQVKFPSLEGARFAPTYSWKFAGAGGAAKILYGTRGLFWAGTRYTLNVASDNTASLTAWADVQNLSSLEYNAPNVTLLAGDVSLNKDQEFAQPNLLLQNQNAPTTPTSSLSKPEQRIVSAGELGGLQSYNYPKPASFAAVATTGLPFIKTSQTVKDVLEYQGQFSTDSRATTSLQRVYSFITPQGLPTGGVTVRENGRLVGQTSIPNTPKLGNVRLNLGKDFDVKLSRIVKPLQESKKSLRYRVDYTIKNVKNRSVNLRIVEFIPSYDGYPIVKLEKVQLPNFVGEPGVFVTKPVIAAGATFKGSYEIVFSLK
jgi:hypothetical protein